MVGSLYLLLDGSYTGKNLIPLSWFTNHENYKLLLGRNHDSDSWFLKLSYHYHDSEQPFSWAPNHDHEKRYAHGAPVKTCLAKLVQSIVGCAFTEKLPFFLKKFTFIAGFLRRCCSTVVPALLFRSCSVDIELFRLCRTTGKWKKRMQFNTNADNFPPSSLFSRFILFLSCRGCCPFRLLCTRSGSALRENSSGSALLTTGKWYKINPFLRL